MYNSSICMVLGHVTCSLQLVFLSRRLSVSISFRITPYLKVLL